MENNKKYVEIISHQFFQGEIKKLEESGIEIYPESKKDIFSIPYTKVNNNVNHGA